MYLELRHLKSIYVIAESGNLTKAAKQLHLTPSALSHQLKAIEEYFSTPLIFRGTRPLKFTPAGLRLLKLAEQILPITDETERALKAMAAGSSGRLHIAIECHSCFAWLIPAMEAFQEKWPDVEMDLTFGFSFAPLPALAQGDIDLVVTSDPVPNDAIQYHPLFQYQCLLAAGKNHPLSSKAFVEPHDIEQETLITYPVERTRMDIYRHFLQPAGIEPANIRTVELTELMVQQISVGKGVSGLPSWGLQEYIDRGTVVGLPLGSQGIWRTLYAATRSEDQSVDFLQTFVKNSRDLCLNILKGIRPTP